MKKSKNFILKIVTSFIIFFIGQSIFAQDGNLISFGNVCVEGRPLLTKEKVTVSWLLVSDFQRDEAPCWGFTYHIWIYNGFDHPITIDENEAYQNSGDNSSCWQSGSIKFNKSTIRQNKCLELQFRIYTGKSGEPGAPGLKYDISWDGSDNSNDKQIIDPPIEYPDISGVWVGTWDNGRLPLKWDIKQNGNQLSIHQWINGESDGSTDCSFINNNSFLWENITGNIVTVKDNNTIIRMDGSKVLVNLKRK